LRLEDELKRSCQLTLDIKHLSDENRELKSQLRSQECNKSKLEDCIAQLRRELYDVMIDGNSKVDNNKVQEIMQLQQSQQQVLISIENKYSSNSQLQADLSEALEQLSKMKAELQAFVEAPSSNTSLSSEAPTGRVTIVFTDIESMYTPYH
jgi:predicted RNase H-like nuclease (RuvC/YqgF family)